MKNSKPIYRVLTIIGLVSVATLSMAQSKDVKKFTPEQQAIYDSAGRKAIAAMVLLRQGKATEALTNVQESIVGDERLHIPGEYYLLAECHLALGEKADALTAFEKCFKWDSRGDLWPKVGDSIAAATDYAVLLSKIGRIDDAKRMYYYALRYLNQYNEVRLEPYPFTVVFDRTPNAEVCTYTPARFEAACLMVKALSVSAGDDFPGWVKKSSKLAPEWLYSVLYQGFRNFENDRKAYFERARKMATSATDRALVERVAGYDQDHMPKDLPKLAEVRKQIPLLNESRLELAKSYPRLLGEGKQNHEVPTKTEAIKP